ncbi:hydantoinase [Solimonas fluminis]|uniref:Hydantoinase n=1 Tax=Solimonas fluminis TaxID=2086571 RepID=A0A2S5TBF3_9GAMM|nr:hydantoinase/oxoprolinase family protein [Solimonas fluminis]PPE72197.1 hydantoinase [Solimonas fluminis]
MKSKQSAAAIKISQVHDVEPAAAKAGKLINIDNGGTLTDICVIDGGRVWRTKTVTTPHDLSKCLLDGLVKASRTIYGRDDLLSLLLSTEYIRYSTTQGTNALVERKGPRLGLILGGTLKAAELQGTAQQTDLLASLVGVRIETLDPSLAGDALETAAVRAVNGLSSAGANRIVVAFGGSARSSGEADLKKLLLRKFPPHLLGAIPILYSHEVVDDAEDARRAWTAMFNAFLHPAMERFLYNAEHKLRQYRTRNPLLIFRNDGHSARVSRTIALKTYSSGPRGGAEGSKALASHYGFRRLLSMDVGGTTTDISLVEDGVVRAHRRGQVEGVETSFPLCDVVSAGVGGSSIIRAEGRAIRVGPESVGGAPGPACFGLGGKEATMTDAFLLGGLLDPASYFGGELRIDVERARAAIGEKVALPLGLTPEKAAQAMEEAWVGKIAASLRDYAPITPDTVLAAFGGAGPFVVCKVAEALGIRRIIIPGLAAVFSAFGIGFSDVAHSFEMPLASNDAAGLQAASELLLLQARRAMFGEGAELEQCRIEQSLRVIDPAGERSIALGEGEPVIPAQARVSLVLQAVKPISHAKLAGEFGKATCGAVSTAKRRTLSGELPLYRVEEQPAGSTAAGPAVLEEAFFTCRIEPGWRFEINQAGDILLSRS